MTKEEYLPAETEETEFMKELPILKRRMEGKGGGGGGGEVRRVHIIYFLSRMGRIEHPHLIRVHHLSRNGVHLRDVKRWLSELRGKDMADSFAWSYKRRYKTGYVWQDLLDDDLITPISDNEYVLKGSEISAISIDPCSRGEKKVSILKTGETPSITPVKENPDLKIDNKEAQIDEDSGPLDSETSTASDESLIRTNSISVSIPDQVEDEQKSKITTKTTTTEIEELNDEIENCLEKEKKNEEEEEEVMEKKKSPSTSSSTSSSSSSFKKGKNYSSGATNVLRNLLNCRAVDTDDSAMMMINKSSSLEICRFETTLDGSDRISCGPWNNPQHKTNRRSYSGEKSSKKSSEFGNQKKVSAAFKPVAEPHCSQCGKGFKPEKLHSHMKSCRGLKSSLGKSTSRSNAAADGAAHAAAEQKLSSSQSSSSTDGAATSKERNLQSCVFAN